jgi:hypothetical protein
METPPMSGSYFDRPDHWRMRAEMTRTIADGMGDGDARRILYGIAQEYERMAQALEQGLQQLLKAEARSGKVSEADSSMPERIAALQRKWNSGRR